jgi:hypothetical protein
MEINNDLKTCWERGKAMEAIPALVTGSDFREIAASQVRKQFKRVAEFVWAAITYQVILYSFLTHTIVRHWGDGRIVLLCVAGGALYVPMTVALLRRVRELFGRVSEANGSTVPDVVAHVEGEYARLASFFRFKKRMDWIGVPVSCGIIVLVTFTLFVGGGQPLASLGLFVAWVGLSTIAIRAENKKRFVVPLRHLELVLDDLKRV